MIKKNWYFIKAIKTDKMINPNLHQYVYYD